MISVNKWRIAEGQDLSPGAGIVRIKDSLYRLTTISIPDSWTADWEFLGISVQQPNIDRKNISGINVFGRFLYWCAAGHVLVPCTSAMPGCPVCVSIGGQFSSSIYEVNQDGSVNVPIPGLTFSGHRDSSGLAEIYINPNFLRQPRRPAYGDSLTGECRDYEFFGQEFPFRK